MQACATARENFQQARDLFTRAEKIHVENFNPIDAALTLRHQAQVSIVPRELGTSQAACLCPCFVSVVQISEIAFEC